MDNIAEGFERGSKNEFVSALTYAKGSAGEVLSRNSIVPSIENTSPKTSSTS
jgi:four helix bundle protein